MASLSQLGFKKGRIAECIVTTRNEDGTPNAAPMGAAAKDAQTLAMKLHTSSGTYKNIIRDKGCVINLVYDPLLLLKTALLRREEKSMQIKKLVKKAGNFFALREAHACVEALLHSRVEKMAQDEYGIKDFSLMKFKVRKIGINKPYPAALNRGVHAAIELAIELSRGKRENVEKYTRVMKKTLAAKEYEEIDKFLKRTITIKGRH